MSDNRGTIQKASNDLVLSFLSVRRAIGMLGFFLPIALILWGLAATEGIFPSISAAYYSPMREVFVGSLIAQAVFLWSYEGYRPRGAEMVSDKATARVAAVAAALVALAPTVPAGLASFDPTQDCTLLQCSLGVGLSGWLHLIAAAIYFVAFAVYCLVLFMRGESDSAEKRASRKIYRVCGWLIVIAVALIGLLFLTGWDAKLVTLRPVFWLETVATFAFATSWLVKGDAMRPLVRGVAALR